MDSLGPASAPGPLIPAPMLTGAPQGQSWHARRATQMSVPPNPPARVDVKYRLSSSGENAAFISPAEVLMAGPRFTGADHSASANDMACTPNTMSSDSGRQPTSRVMATIEVTKRCAVLIAPSLLVVLSPRDVDVRSTQAPGAT